MAALCVCVWGVCFGGPFPSSGVFLEEFFSALGGGSSLGALAQPQVGVSPWEEAISASWWGSLLGGGSYISPRVLFFEALYQCWVGVGALSWGLFLSSGGSSSLGGLPQPGGGFFWGAGFMFHISSEWGLFLAGFTSA